MEKGSVKAGNSEKSSYRYAILFFSLKLLLLLRTRLESSSYQKKKKKKKGQSKDMQKDLAKFGNSGDFFSPNLSNENIERAGSNCHSHETIIFPTYPCKFCCNSSFSLSNTLVQTDIDVLFPTSQIIPAYKRKLK